MKITVLGDLMCEPWILHSAKQKDGSYCFDELFEYLKPMLSEADYAIANMEFPLGGEEVGYTDSFYTFNAPDAFADAIKKAGIRMVSTANNHSYDRDLNGLRRTIRVLDEKGIAHTGTFLDRADRKEAAYFTVGDTTFAFHASTYCTNKCAKKSMEDPDYDGCVNLLRDHRKYVYLPGVLREKDWIDKTFKKLGAERCGRIKKWLGKPSNYSRADDNLIPEETDPFLEVLHEDMKIAKEKADILISFPHMGGQFNPVPGAISEYCMEKFVEFGADVVLAGHSHMLQKMEMKGDVPCVFSLGNVSMSPDSSLMMKEMLPEYAIAVHLYVEDKKIQKMTFSVIKAVEKRPHQMRSYPVDVLYEKLSPKKQKKLMEDVRRVLIMLTGDAPEDNLIQKEYDFYTR